MRAEVFHEVKIKSQKEPKLQHIVITNILSHGNKIVFSLSRSVIMQMFIILKNLVAFMYDNLQHPNFDQTTEIFSLFHAAILARRKIYKL